VAYRLFWTMFNVRTTRTNAIVEELLEDHQRQLLKTVVSKSELLNQANMAGVPITQYASTSRGAQEYQALCDELLSIKK
jgi:cellulose biosynthesis protein BcsQ